MANNYKSINSRKVKSYDDYDYNRGLEYRNKEQDDYRRVTTPAKSEAKKSRVDAVINAKQTPRNANDLYQGKPKSNGTYAEKAQSDYERGKDILGNAFAQKSRKDYESVRNKKTADQRRKQSIDEDRANNEKAVKKSIRDNEEYTQMEMRSKAKQSMEKAGNRARLTMEWNRTLDKAAERTRAKREEEERKQKKRNARSVPQYNNSARMK